MPDDPDEVDAGGATVDESTFLRPPRPSLQQRTISRPAFMLELQRGSPVGEYEIQDQIGEGAMGTVFSALHPLIGKMVAVKVLKPELCANQASIDRFVQEAQSVNRIGHPNIVDVFSLGELPDGRAYFVMEWLRGEDLKSRLARGPVTVADTCDILDGVVRALAAAHAKDIVHRDLKPDNIYLHQVDGGPRMVKLLDFGIAKLMRSQMKMEKTQTGNMLGTPRYISPEQARGIDVDHRSDIYSLGVIAYEMLAGRPPFQGETAMDLVVKHLSDPAPPLSQFVRVPKLLEQCVMGMLEKDPKARPSLDVVRQILSEPTKRSAALAKGFAGKRSRTPLVVGGVLVAAIGGFVAWKLLSSEPPRSTGSPSSPTTVVVAPVAPAGTAPAPAPMPTPTPTPTPAPAAGAALRGTLHVTVTGAKSAVISVDGTELGRGEAVNAELAPGRHAVEVRAPGRELIVQHVDITAGAANTVAVVVPPPPKTVPRTNRVTKPSSGTTTKPPPPPPNDDELMRPKGNRK